MYLLHESNLDTFKNLCCEGKQVGCPMWSPLRSLRELRGTKYLRTRCVASLLARLEFNLAGAARPFACSGQTRTIHREARVSWVPHWSDTLKEGVREGTLVPSRVWQARQGSNLRPQVLETCALPTELRAY